MHSSNPLPVAGNSTDGAKPKLRDQVHQVLRTRHYSPRTEEAYFGWILRYIYFHQKRHPQELGTKQRFTNFSHI